ncbi:MAG: BglII/BstYI family type II restriction endonuclease, partial [Bacteroidota bacterium]
EIEWNNKDPFFDRDLQSFRNLHADGAISMGIIVTRGSSLQNGFKGKMIEFARNSNINNIESLEQYYVPTRSQKSAILKKINAGSSFQEAWADTFVSSKFGKSTTHWDKLIDRVDRGVGNPCPLILIGIPLTVVTDSLLP